MSISSIQGISGLETQYSGRIRRAASETTAPSRSTGPDTVTLSAEAMEMAGLSSQKESAEAEAATDESGAAKEQATSGSGSLKQQGVSLFGLILESLFLADLESNEQSSAQGEESVSTEGGQTQTLANPFQDNPKSAELKQLLEKVVTGKADITDLPKAMASGAAKNGVQGVASVATQKKTDTEGAAELQA